MEQNRQTIEKYIEKINKETIPDILPAIATRTKMITYPNTVIPMFIGREKSLEALELSLSKFNNYVFLVSQKELDTDDPTAEELHKIGTVAKIVQISKMPNGDYKILVEGLKRASVKEIMEFEKSFIFSVSIFDSSYKKTKILEALVRKVKNLFQKYMELIKKFPQEAFLSIEETTDPEIIADLIASILPLELDEKQELLEIVNLKKLLETELEILTREIELLEIEEKLENSVKEKIEKTQKEFYLREKLKVIQNELEDGEDREIEEIKEKIEKTELPSEVKEKAEKELSRLAKMSPYSPESSVIRTYLDQIINFPWEKRDSYDVDFEKAEKLLSENHYGLEDVKERILEYIAIKNMYPSSKSPILCFVGAPGVGKTSLGKSIADSLGRKYVRISLGGVKDEAEIRGHRRTYVGALPGRIIQSISKAQSINPVIVLDEIDKMGISYQGDPSAALLEVLDPEQNNSFVDHYMELPVDLSDVIFVTTANVVHTIPPALLDRMEVIFISGYTDVEKYEIAKKYILPKLEREIGIKDKIYSFTPSAIKEIILHYTREAGVRSLEKQISKLIRKVVLNYSKNNKIIKINKNNISEYLGKPVYFDTKKNVSSEVGVVTGMAWTAYGGTILTIEAEKLSGKGNFTITGQLGDVMKESARISLTLVEKLIQQYYKEDTDIKKYDIHIHVPEGAVPKDGPSAGVTLTTAVFSCITGKEVKNSVSMTGEITLKGHVLPVGGIKEKILSAYRSGITEIILPYENQKDYDKIPQEVKDKINVHFVKDIKEVLSLALKGGINFENN